MQRLFSSVFRCWLCESRARRTIFFTPSEFVLMTNTLTFALSEAALAVYSYLIGIKGGYLVFPSETELHNPPSNGHFKTTIVYTTLMAHFKRLCDDVLQPRDNGIKVGCHSFRKTGYLVAVFGKAV
jgi:hypothetical protein